MRTLLVLALLVVGCGAEPEGVSICFDDGRCLHCPNPTTVFECGPTRDERTEKVISSREEGQ
jgi:hypothetical protein